MSVLEVLTKFKPCSGSFAQNGDPKFPTGPMATIRLEFERRYDQDCNKYYKMHNIS